MDSSDLLRFGILFILLVLSAFFSSSETALLTANKVRMKADASAGDSKAAKVLKLCENQDRTISAILIGNNIVNLYASSLATSLAMDLWGSRSTAIATGVLTLLVLVFGEVTPKAMSTRYADTMSRIIAGPLDVLAVVLTPAIKLVNFLAGLIMRLCGMDPDKEKDAMTEEELRTLVEVSHEDGVIETEEKEMITNVVDFGDTVVKDIMIPRVDMTTISIDASYKELLSLYRDTRYTRIPVWEKSPDNVIGILNMKDLLLCDKDSTFTVADHMRKPMYTYEYKKTSVLLKEMRKKLVNAAIVLDEYGVTAGMVTMEDILEEIVGEIRDEYDYDETENIIKVQDDEYIVDGATKPEELNERFDLMLDEEDSESLSGVIMNLLDDVPEKGDVVNTETCRMVVESMDRMRIDKVRLYLCRTQHENPVQSE